MRYETRFQIPASTWLEQTSSRTDRAGVTCECNNPRTVQPGGFHKLLQQQTSLDFKIETQT